ncbi:DUF6318 family protein [Nocardioides montaniterrae]
MKRILVAAALLTLTACGSDPAPPPASPSSSSTSPSPTNTAPVEPQMPGAATVDSKAGAIAFAKYYWQVVNYAQATGDTKYLSVLQHGSCRACTAGRKWIDSVYRAGGKISGGRYRLLSASAQKLPLPSTATPAFAVIIRARTTGERVTGAGKLDRRFPPSDAQITMGVQQFMATWQISSWSIR